jgi:hypothetical protein
MDWKRAVMIARGTDNGADGYTFWISVSLVAKV